MLLDDLPLPPTALVIGAAARLAKIEHVRWCEGRCWRCAGRRQQKAGQLLVVVLVLLSLPLQQRLQPNLLVEEVLLEGELVRAGLVMGGKEIGRRLLTTSITQRAQ